MITRREMICLGAGAAAALLCLPSFRSRQGTFKPPGGVPYTGTDDQLLDQIQQASFNFFWNEASPRSGQVKDRALALGG